MLGREGRETVCGERMDVRREGSLDEEAADKAVLGGGQRESHGEERAERLCVGRRARIVGEKKQ